MGGYLSFPSWSVIVLYHSCFIVQSQFTWDLRRRERLSSPKVLPELPWLLEEWIGMLPLLARLGGPARAYGIQEKTGRNIWLAYNIVKEHEYKPTHTSY